MLNPGHREDHFKLQDMPWISSLRFGETTINARKTKKEFIDKAPHFYDADM